MKSKIEQIREKYHYEMRKLDEDVIISCPEDIKQWLVIVEPKYRYCTSRPDDWKFRSRFIRSLYNYTCQNCGRSEDSDRNQFDTHHLIPLKDGGNNTFENLVCLCRKCHQKHHPFNFDTYYD